MAPALKDRTQHEAQVSQLCQQILHSPHTVALGNNLGKSNTTRNKPYREQCLLLGINHLDGVIDIDTEAGIALVEPRVTMEQLVSATLEKGMIPAVVPEFRGITVGGAIMGGGIESSSHRYGLFSDCCLWADVVLGNGERLRISKDEHSDLFHALPGSYGSLCLLTLVAIRLIPAKRWVHLRYVHATCPEDALNMMRRLSSQDRSALFIDGMVLSPNNYVIMIGELTDRAHPLNRLPRYRTRPWWSEWFYQHVYRVAYEHAHDEMLPLRDYLFRYDRGAFWMGRYVRRPAILIDYLLKRPLLKWDTKLFEEQPHVPSKMPSKLFRFLFGWKMGTRSLYKGLHSMPEELLSAAYMIQDCGVSFSQARQFLSECEKAYKIYPMWLCPCRAGHKEQILSPHYMPENSEDLVLNVGLYGVPQFEDGVIAATQDLEERVTDLQGRKALYSQSYYTREQFWQIYPREDYEALRQKYHAIDTFVDLASKVL